MIKSKFRSQLGENVFRFKYSQGSEDSWDSCAERIVEDVCGGRWGTTPPLMSQDKRDQLAQYIKEFKFIPGGRYIYYAGRPNHYYNNCFLLKAEEDTREEWAALAQRATSCLMTGGGIGVDYSVLRAKGKPIRKTGGVSSGPISLMNMLNEIGRNVMQGGSRRSAIYASLNWSHEDIPLFLQAKNWNSTIKQLKTEDFNFPAQLDMTNISLNYDDAWLNAGNESLSEFEKNTIRSINPTFLQNCRQAMETGEPGFSFNFGDKQNETLRNACTEVTSEDDSDVCNLGSINIGNISSLEEFKSVVALGSEFLVCGTLRADLPYQKVYAVRERNRRLGLGLMGIHEWLLKRSYKYEVVPELHKWLEAYKEYSEDAANKHATGSLLAGLKHIEQLRQLEQLESLLEPLLELSHCSLLRISVDTSRTAHDGTMNIVLTLQPKL